MKKIVKQYFSACLAVALLLMLMPATNVFAGDAGAFALNFNDSTQLPTGVTDSSSTGTLSIDTETFADDAFQKNFLKLEGVSTGYAQTLIAFDSITPEGTNKYAEMSFDLYTSGVAAVGSSITMRIGTKVLNAVMKNPGGMYFENDSSTKIADTAKFDSGAWVNYKLVFHLTDASGNAVNQLVDVYENGVDIMDAEGYSFTEDYGTLKQVSFQLSKKSGEYWLGLDNFSVVSYSSADGSSPVPDKAALKAGIQSAQAALSGKKHLLDATAVSGFETEIEQLFTVYENVNADAAAVEAATENAETLKAEIEAAADAAPEPDAGSGTFQIAYAKNFNGSTSVPSGITNTGDTLSIDNTTFAGKTYYDNYLKLRGSSDAYAALTIAFEAIKPEGANKYAEIGFDLFTAGQKAAGSHITMRLSNKVKSLYLANGGGLYIGENSSGAKLASAGALDNENWVNYRLVMHLTDAAGNKVNKIIGVYENGVNITQDVDCPFNESYATLSQITMQLSKKAGTYSLGLDNVFIAAFTSADGTSPVADRAYLKTEGENILKALDSHLSADALYEEMKKEVLDAAGIYTAETVTVDEITGAKKKLEAVSNRINAILSLKESGDAVYVVEPTLSSDDLRGLSEVTAQMQLVTYDKAYAGHVVAVLLGESDTLPQGKVLDVVSEAVNLKANDTAVQELAIDLSSYTNLEKQNMRIAAFVLTDLNSLSFANENVYWLLGSEASCETEKYTFGADVNAALKIIDNENQKIIITVNGGVNAAGKLISAAVLKKDLAFADITDEVEESVEYIYRTVADENGYAVFELSPESGAGNYAYQVASAAFNTVYSGTIAYSSAAIINNAFATVYKDSGLTSIKENAEILTIDKKLLEHAETSNVAVEEVIKQVLSEKTYDALSLDAFSEKANGALALLSGIINAKSVDITQNLLETYQSLLANGDTLLALKPGATYTNAVKYIYNHKTDAITLGALDSMILTAIEEAKKAVAETGGSTGGGGGGGGFGGGGAVGAPAGTAAGYPKVGEAMEPEEAEKNEAPAEKAAGRFHDLTEVEWAVPAISLLTTAGCINGKEEGVFAPHDDITREEFVKMTVLAFGFGDDAAIATFADVEPDSWYAPYVAAAANAGIVTGESETHFGVGRNITRQEMAAILYRVLTLKGQGITEDGVYIEFNDEFKFEAYAKDAIIALAKSGIVNGVGGNEFMPERNSTRAEAAKMLYEAYVRIN